MAVRSHKPRVHVEDGLHVVIPGGNLAKAERRVARRRFIDDEYLVRLDPVDVDTEEWRACHPGTEVGNALLVRTEKRHAVLPRACLPTRFDALLRAAKCAWCRGDDVWSVDALRDDHERATRDSGSMRSRTG